MAPSVREFYAGQSIFVTGGTGFLGKVLIEKLLRCCPDISNIYLLVRPKKNKDPQQRITDLLDFKLFDKLREEKPEVLQKVRAISGDICDENLGISQLDERVLIEEVSIVFHSAATVKFDELLKLSVEMNVLGVKKMINLCNKFKRLKAFVHVSTAYANCNREHIAEAVYPPPLHPNKLLDAVEWMPDEVIDTLTPKMILDRPNTYTYTKAMAEYLLVEEAGDLPVAICRPSIVGASWKEPFPGWVDNFNGPTGIFAGIGKGVLRIMKGNIDGTADVIPVDVTANLLIVAGWNVGVERPKTVPVYNNTTGQINRFTWGQMERMTYEYFMKNPLDQVVRIPNPRFTKSAIWHDLNIWFDHFIPAYMFDFFYMLIGKRPIMTMVQQKIYKSLQSLDFFTSNQWTFENNNLYALMDKMSASDREEFCFDVRGLNWPKYIENYCLGTKRFVLKENLEQMPAARRALKRLQRYHYMIKIVLGVVIWRLLVRRINVAKKLWDLMLSLATSLVTKLPVIARS